MKSSRYFQLLCLSKLANFLKYIAHDEEGHVTYLEAGLTAAGASPVAACNYSFPMGTPKEFITMASTIEGVGVSAYLGAAPQITSKSYLTAAGAILVTEALHQSAARGAVGEIPMANVFGTPLGLNAVYTIASNFITSCPSSNVALPVKAYPQLTLMSGAPTSQNATISISTKSMLSGAYYATFVSGINIIPVSPTKVSDGLVMIAVPLNISGQTYVFLTSDNSGNITDDTVLAGMTLQVIRSTTMANLMSGPAILEVTPSSPSFNLTVTR